MREALITDPIIFSGLRSLQREHQSLSTDRQTFEDFLNFNPLNFLNVDPLNFINLTPLPPMLLFALTAVATYGITVQTGLVQQFLNAIGNYQTNR